MIDAELRLANLNNTGISSLSALTGLGSLETVYAAGNAITSLSGFNQLGALRKLVVSNNGITDLAPLENGDHAPCVAKRGTSGDGTVPGFQKGMEAGARPFSRIRRKHRAGYTPAGG